MTSIATGGIVMLAPADVHHGRAETMIAQRERTLQQAWAQHPERFVYGKPKPQARPHRVWINRLHTVGSLDLRGIAGIR